MEPMSCKSLISVSMCCDHNVANYSLFLILLLLMMLSLSLLLSMSSIVQCIHSLLSACLSHRIAGQNIAGTVPDVLAKFDFLQPIRLASNAFSGTIPEVYGHMRDLIDIELHRNRLTGTIPQTMFTETTFSTNSLQNLNLGGNMLTGTLSTEVGRLTDLKGLHLFKNLFHRYISYRGWPTEGLSLPAKLWQCVQRETTIRACSARSVPEFVVP